MIDKRTPQASLDLLSRSFFSEKAGRHCQRIVNERIARANCPKYLSRYESVLQSDERYDSMNRSLVLPTSLPILAICSTSGISLH